MTRPFRSVVTILFTDIVASTQRAAALGDWKWGRILEEHHALVRREIHRFGGGEANMSGDGFLATFERPAAAIRCAQAIRESVKELGLDVRQDEDKAVAALAGQVGGGDVPDIAEAVDGVVHRADGLFPDTRPGVQHPVDRGEGNPRLTRDVVHRRSHVSLHFPGLSARV